MKVYQVSQVSVIKVSESPLVLNIQVSGLAATTGWTNPRLENSGDPNPDDAILEFCFEADRPSGPVLPVLTPIMVCVDVQPTNGADAVIISSRTNSITVHAAEFMTPGSSYPGLTTLAIGEEEPKVTTFAIGEEDPKVTTLAIGEEEPKVTTLAIGEEDPKVTTLAIGEEGNPFGSYQ